MKRLLPFIILGLSAALVAALLLTRPEAGAVAPERPVTQVEILVAEPLDTTLEVRSQGTVLPEIESNLAVEVAGRIVEVSEQFRAGGRFAVGDVLFRIDPADYEAAVAARRAAVADAELALAQETALAAQARSDWTALGSGTPSELTLRGPQLASAEARLESARAALRQAERDLARTEIRAPFDGEVLRKNVDLGQYVMANPAEAAARIFATGAAEVRLPLRLEELAWLVDPAQAPSKVTLARGKGSARQEWEATLVRFESTIDPQSRLIYAVARIDNPLEKGIRRGLFVEASITGRRVESVYALPRYVLRGERAVYLVDEAGGLVTREVDILQSNAESVIIRGGLLPGDRVATSPIAYFTEGMPVEIITNKP